MKSNSTTKQLEEKKDIKEDRINSVSKEVHLLLDKYIDDEMMDDETFHMLADELAELFEKIYESYN